jgi:inner membrane protein
MEPVTHALTCIALGRASVNKASRAATSMLVVSGVAADADWITRLGGASFFLHGHRTVTHSLLGTAVIAAGVAAAFWAGGKRYPRIAVEFSSVLWICALGAGTHLLLDLLNPWGIQLLWPFTKRWYAWDIASSVDAWLIFCLLCGLLVPELFRLIHEEIGSKSKNNGRQRGAIAGLVLAIAFLSARWYAHGRAIALLDAREYRTETPLVVGAFPRPSNPLVWEGVVETDDALFNMEVPLSPGSAFDPESAEVHFKPQTSLALKNAAASPAAADLLNFAHFPLANVQPRGDGYEAKFRDMRFESELSGQRGILAVVELNAQSLVVSSRLAFDGESAK